MRTLRGHNLQNLDLVKFLRIFGLNLYEAKIYLTLLSQGRLTPSEVYKRAQVPQPRIYDTLKSLESKGLVRKELSDNTYIALPFSSVLKKQKVEKKLLELEENWHQFTEKLKAVEEQMHILKEEDQFALMLERLAKKPRFDSGIMYKMEGTDVVATELIKLFDHATNNVINVTKNPPLLLYPPEPIFKKISEKMNEGIKYKRVISLDYILGEGLRNTQADIKKGVTVRVLPDDMIPAKFYVFDESSTLIRSDVSAMEPISAVVITKHKEIAAALTKLFEFLWGKGLPLEIVIKKLRGLNPPSGLTKIELAIHRFLLEHGRGTLNEIMENLRLDKEVSKAVSKMMKMGLIERIEVLDKYKLTVLPQYLKEVF